MSRNHRIMLLSIFGAVLAVAVLIGAGRLLAATLADNYPPETVNYQGYLTDSGGNPISGTATLQFTIWDASSGGNSVWSETHNNVPVTSGYFSVLLGSQGTPLTAAEFQGSPRYLEVVYDATTFPRQPFSSVPYALVANYATEAVTATYALNAPGGSYQYVVTVAKSGGDFTTINDALASISPGENSRYLIWVAPGLYTETVTLPEYVYLQGAGANITGLTSVNTGNQNNASTATLVVPANAQVSDIVVSNTGNTNNQDAVAIHIADGNDKTVLRNVRALANGVGGARHVAIYLDSGNPTLTSVTTEASGAATVFNAGIFNSASAPGIYNSGITASGFNATGLRLNGGNPIIKESTISGKNGSNGKGIDSSGSGATVKIDRATIAGDAGTGASISSSNVSDDFFVGASMLDGDVDVFTNSDITCAQSYNGAYTDVNANCAP